MKTKIFLALLTIAVFSAFKFAPDARNLATVEQQQGVYIFVQSKPTAQYDYLGSIKVPQQFTGEPHEQLNTALKKLKKEFPSANGIIFTDLDMKGADAVKFKE